VIRVITFFVSLYLIIGLIAAILFHWCETQFFDNVEDSNEIKFQPYGWGTYFHMVLTWPWNVEFIWKPWIHWDEFSITWKYNAKKGHK